MKKVLSIVCVLWMSVSAFSQITKQVVNVEGFSYSSVFSEAEAFIVRNNVIQSLQATKRIIVVDLMQQNSINAEAERRKSEAALNDDHEVADITQLNANYIVKGMLNSIDVQHKSGKNVIGGGTYSYYEASLNYTIQLINPATGATESSYTYTAFGRDDNSQGGARAAAISASSANMNKFIEEAFPVKGTILKVESGDAKKAKTVYINIGKDQGIQKGQKFVVYALVDVAGEKSEKEIGTLTAVEVMSATRTLCKVNDGGDVIAQNLASNIEMSIKSRAKKGLFGD